MRAASSLCLQASVLVVVIVIELRVALSGARRRVHVRVAAWRALTEARRRVQRVAHGLRASTMAAAVLSGWLAWSVMADGRRRAGSMQRRAARTSSACR